MTSVLAKTLLESAIAVSDWLLSCQRVRRPERYNTIFQHLYKIFRQNQADEEAYLLFLDFLNDVFDILNEAQIKGHITIGNAAPDGSSENKIEVDKTYSEILRETEDFLMFLLVFAKSLDNESSPAGQEDHVCNVVNTLSNLKPKEADTEDGYVNLRLKVMMNGFNFLAKDSVFRYAACMRIAEFAAEHNCFDQLMPYIDVMEEWVSTGSPLLSVQRRKLFCLIADQLRKKGLRDRALFKFQSKLVKEFDQEVDSTLLEGSSEAAVELVTLGIQILEVVTFDEIIHSKSVQKLRGTDHAHLFELGRIFYEGDHNDLSAFIKDHSALFPKYNLDANKCMEKIRLLVIASMASSLAPAPSALKSQKLSLSSVCERLQMTSAEAESLAVRAISLGVLDGQIDQLNGDIVVCSSLQRSFGTQQWEQLYKRLTSLNNNITAVLNHVDKPITTVR